MVFMEKVRKKNESEMNETVAKGLVGLFCGIVLTVMFCWIGIFDIHMGMTIALLVTSVVTLVLPAAMVLILHIYDTKINDEENSDYGGSIDDVCIGKFYSHIFTKSERDERNPRRLGECLL